MKPTTELLLAKTITDRRLRAPGKHAGLLRLRAQIIRSRIGLAAGPCRSLGLTGRLNVMRLASGRLLLAGEPGLPAPPSPDPDQAAWGFCSGAHGRIASGST